MENSYTLKPLLVNRPSLETASPALGKAARVLVVPQGKGQRSVRAKAHLPGQGLWREISIVKSQEMRTLERVQDKDSANKPQRMSMFHGSCSVFLVRLSVY